MLELIRASFLILQNVVQFNGKSERRDGNNERFLKVFVHDAQSAFSWSERAAPEDKNRE